jgi:hypothetical protein
MKSLLREHLQRKQGQKNNTQAHLFCDFRRFLADGIV